MSRVPVWTVVATGVVLSVKVPKVPRPATAAAVPAMASEPTTLRVLLRRVLLLMSVCLPVSVPPPGSGDRENIERPTAGHPPGIRKESARLVRETLRSAENRGIPGFRTPSSVLYGDKARVLYRHKARGSGGEGEGE